ncbi:MAG TPA: hypothetical protein PKC76_05730 [Saprospiraceae bacterium]|nr:hypothetical protein [Saprospiraceae bacterium]HMP23610.1 hypothetical protein [Saprospiraceae bacterium]
MKRFQANASLHIIRQPALKTKPFGIRFSLKNTSPDTQGKRVGKKTE